jgi:lysophospholipase L1-like esterase
MHEEFVPNSAAGSADYLHPNRCGYQARGEAVRLSRAAIG